MQNQLVLIDQKLIYAADNLGYAHLINIILKGNLYIIDN